MRNGKLRVAVAGLGFGGAFVPIWACHPDVYALDLIEPCGRTLDLFLKNCPGLPVNRCWPNLEDALKDPGIDAVHLVTPIPLHARQSVAVLRAGKHCACTVPAAVTLDELSELVTEERESGKNYMMMETAAYTWHCLKAKREYLAGTFGQLQLLRGCHYQDMEAWPDYWLGLPPMHYATHAVAPLLSISGARVKKVHCFGSGSMRAELREQYKNPYPAETAIFRLDGCEAAMEITRILFENPRRYCEGFSLYGSKATLDYSYETPLELQIFADNGVNTGRRGRPVKSISFPEEDFSGLLPPEIARFTHPGNYDDTNPQNTFMTGGGHHGSHPHLVHEFARSIVENRSSAISASVAANWSAAGICAHISAMKDGEAVEIPVFC